MNKKKRTFPRLHTQYPVLGDRDLEYLSEVADAFNLPASVHRYLSLYAERLSGKNANDAALSVGFSPSSINYVLGGWHTLKRHFRWISKTCPGVDVTGLSELIRPFADPIIRKEKIKAEIEKLESLIQNTEKTQELRRARLQSLRARL